MSYQKFTPLTPELYEYCLELNHNQSKALNLMGQDNGNHPQISMQISSDEARFLQFLIKAKQCSRILELGTFLGYSTAAMALALPDHGIVTTLDIDANATAIAKKNWEYAHLSHKIQLILGPALESLRALENQKQQFDFIFIDADKGNYIAYYEYAKKLLTASGIIAIDNVLYHGEVCAEYPSKTAQKIREFNLYVKSDSSMDISVIPIADGLLLAQFH